MNKTYRITLNFPDDKPLIRTGTLSWDCADLFQIYDGARLVIALPYSAVKYVEEVEPE